MKKLYVGDTNVFLHDPSALHAFDDNELIIPLIVLEELDRQKSRQDEIGANARNVCRQLDELRKEGNLMTGVELPNGGLLRIATIDATALQKLPCELKVEKNDNLIIAFMLSLQETASKRRRPILVSRDINVRVKCDALGIKCEDYRRTKLASSLDELYSGVATLEVADDELAKLYEVGSMVPPCAVHPNQIVVMKSTSGGPSTLTKCVLTDGTKRLEPINIINDAYGLKPRNKEQQFSLDLLYDERIKLVTLSGAAGTGKSLITIASALDQLKGVGNTPTYDKFIVMRPVQPVGRDIGFLPGTLEEKMEPWIAPIRDNINFLLGIKGSKPKGRKVKGVSMVSDDAYIAMAQESGLIEVEAITFMRGRSIPNAFILVDESQNLSIHELKTLITRAGENTKIVLTGDICQIDNHHVDAFTNGLTYAIEKFKEYAIAGHVALRKGERSTLATIASEIL